MKRKIVMIGILAFLFATANVHAVTFSEKLISKANGINVESYAEGNTAEMYTFNHEETRQTLALTDYRYIGDEPNNYVYFNCEDDDETSSCEKWRIIGVFDVEDGLGNTEKRVKLIGPMVGPTNGLCSFPLNDQNVLHILNGRLDNNCFSYRLNDSAESKIKDAKYYLGNVDHNSGKWMNSPASDIYQQERGGRSSGEVNRIDRVGLMYLSDYIYSATADDEQCFSDISYCGSSSWLYALKYQLTMTMVDSFAARITLRGFDANGFAGSTVLEPVVYLKSDISVLEGDGSIDNPYQLINPAEIEESEEEENGISDILKKAKFLRDRIVLAATKEATIEAAIKKISDKSNPDFSTIARTKEGLFKTEDDYGDSYYYRGQADNYVLYAGYLWRIIRINGDKSIRLIYSGTQENYTGENTIINAGQCNPNYDVSYVSSDGTDRGIKTIIDEWYEKNILDKKDEEGNSYTSYLADSNFCNDRSRGNSNNFGAADRILASTPSLKCPQEDDILTVNNGKLKYPIATITVDEVALAGGKNSKINSKYYLNTNQGYWTMSPNSVSGEYSYMFFIPSTGEISSLISLSYCGGIRPVVNLKSDIYVSAGNGTIDNPYQVSLTEPKEEEEIIINEENPDTGDSLIFYIMISVISLVGLTASVFKLNKSVK